MVSVFLRLPALRKSSSESCDTGHVGYPVLVGIVISSEPVLTDIQVRQCPDGTTNIRGQTGDILDILVLTCTWE